jgi:two-component system, cell cycle sensor histidine kinase DivJ
MVVWSDVRVWLGAVPILRLTAAGSAGIIVLLLIAHVNGTVTARQNEVARRMDAATALVFSRLSEIGREMETIRREASTILLLRSGREFWRDSPLMRTFLASNPTDEGGRLFNLDVLPAPYSTQYCGNLLAMPTTAVRRRTGLMRMDMQGWQDEAAMLLSLSSRLENARQSRPSMQRLVYVSVSGLAYISPWIRSDETDLLESYVNWDSFRRGTPEITLDRQTFWSVGTEPGTLAVASPLDHRSRFLGVFVGDISVAELLRDVDIQLRDRLALVDGSGRILGPLSSQETSTQETAIRDGEHIAERLIVPAMGWRLVWVGRPASLWLETMWGLAPQLLPVGILLLLGIGVSYVLILRILRDREAVAGAEREARSKAEVTLAELRSAHDELDFLNREKTRFFSLISHDLRGPFNTLLGMTEELARYAPSMKPADVSDFAATTHESARKVFDLLETLLQWSRVQMSGKPFQPSVFPLRELMDDAVREIGATAQSKGVKVLDAVGDRWVLADRTMVLAIMRNLLANAVKFSFPDGTIHLTTRAVMDRVEVAVVDHGVGIDAAQAQVLFETPVSRPGTRGETGSGLGLKLVRDLALRHGGDLFVESEPGKGTTVRFSLPLSIPPASQKPAA